MYERELEMQRMMAEGSTKAQICEQLAKMHGVSPRTVEAQYYALVDKLSALVVEGRAELRATLMARNNHIYKISLQEGKYKTALDATVAQAKLGGLYENVQTEQKQPDVINIGERDYSQPLKVVGGASGKG